VYERCLAHELRLRRAAFVRQLPLSVEYKGLRLPWGYRVDLLVEVKAVERLLPIHSAQLLTYLRLLRIAHGLLINFNAVRVVEGLRRVVLTSAPREKSLATSRS
jgi:GxxExxY protein